MSRAKLILSESTFVMELVEGIVLDPYWRSLGGTFGDSNKLWYFPLEKLGALQTRLAATGVSFEIVDEWGTKQENPAAQEGSEFHEMAESCLLVDDEPEVELQVIEDPKAITVTAESIAETFGLEIPSEVAVWMNDVLLAAEVLRELGHKRATESIMRVVYKEAFKFGSE